jgi:hypothetical protein
VDLNYEILWNQKLLINKNNKKQSQRRFYENFLKIAFLSTTWYANKYLITIFQSFAFNIWRLKEFSNLIYIFDVAIQILFSHRFIQHLGNVVISTKRLAGCLSWVSKDQKFFSTCFVDLVKNWVKVRFGMIFNLKMNNKLDLWETFLSKFKTIT